MNALTPTHLLPRAALRRVALACVLSLAAAAGHAADPKASQFYEDALVRYEKKDLTGAIIQLKNAIKIDPTMLPVQMLLGRVLLANGEVGAAEVAFNEALKLGVNRVEVILPLAEAVTAQGKPDQLLSQPRFAHADLPADIKAKLLLIKAGAASDLGQAREAIKYLEEARTLNAGDSDSWAAEVPIRIRARQMAEAKVAGDKAVALDPKSPRAAYQQASVAHVSGDLKTAVAMYTRTLALKPGHVDALVARAGLYVDLNQMTEAAADVQAARKADPKDPRSAYLSALLNERQGNAAETKKQLNEVTNLLDPLPLEFIRYRPQLLMLGGMSHFGLDQYEKAKPYLEMVLRTDANSPVSKLLARIYLRERRTDKAVEALDTYLRTHPNDRQAIMLLASSQMAMGRYARSAQLMDEALKKGDDPSMRALLGISLVRAGKYSTAAAELEATLKKDPGQIQAGVALAGLYIASGQGTKAVDVAQALVKRQPQNPGLVSLLGSAMASKGDAAGARAAFEQAVKLDPKFTEPQLNLARLDIDERAFDSANKRLNALLVKDEKNIEVVMEIARLYNASGRPDEAQRWLQRADDGSGERLQPGLQLIDFHLARGRPDLAREPLKRLQNKAPEALAVLLAQARVQLANKEVNEAKATLTRAATLVSFDAPALTQIAELQVRAGNAPGAAHALDKALATQPTHLRARALRSNVYLLQGDPTKAEELARSVLASDPKAAIGHSLMGDIARFRNQLPAAAEAYKRAHAIEQTSESLLRVFSVLDINQHAAAVVLAEQWLRGKPDDVRVWRALADAQARAGDMKAARASYENVIKRSPQDADALNNLANVLIVLKDPSAQQVAEQALKIKPEAPYIIGTAGWAAFNAKQPERALQLLRDARLRDPNNPATRYFLGAVLAQQGRKTEAREELEAALRGGKGFAYAKEAEDLLKTLR